MEYQPVVYDSLKYYVDVGFLCDRWLEPHRKYHDMTHLSGLLAYIPDVAEVYSLNRDQVIALHYMAWFHDAVYDPEPKDNEAQSAYLAEAFFDIYYVHTTYADLVIPTIIGTQGHRDVHYFLQGLFYDMDLAGLGSDPTDYLRNTHNVRAEYSMFTEEEWEAGRQAFLEDFLTRETIFHTSWGAQFEEQARKNMMAELALLRNAEWPWEKPKPVEKEEWTMGGYSVSTTTTSPSVYVPQLNLTPVTYSLGNSITSTPITGNLTGSLGTYTYTQLLDTVNAKDEDKPKKKKKKKKKLGKKRA